MSGKGAGKGNANARKGQGWTVCVSLTYKESAAFLAALGKQATAKDVNVYVRSLVKQEALRLLQK